MDEDENDEDPSCVHYCKADINVNVWAVGSVVEQLVLNGLRNGYSLLPKMCEEFIELYPHLHPDNDPEVSKGLKRGMYMYVDGGILFCFVFFLKLKETI